MVKPKPPVVENHDGVIVVRDDLLPGGTKARFLGALFDGVEEVVYASPAEGGAQTALAQVAKDLGKKATIFVAQRKDPHPRALMAKRLGAQVLQVGPAGYLAVVQARARAYCQAYGAKLMPFGADMPEAIDVIAAAARSLTAKGGPLTGPPDEVWCASGSGVLARGLALAFPKADRHVVEVGRTLAPEDVAGATIHKAGMPFGKADPCRPPFPSDPHYDAKAWRVMDRETRDRRPSLSRVRGDKWVLFWNVLGPAVP